MIGLLPESNNENGGYMMPVYEDDTRDEFEEVGDFWPLYGLQQLSTDKFIKVVNEILRGRSLLTSPYYSGFAKDKD
jgi:hypothetical protein